MTNYTHTHDGGVGGDGDGADEDDEDDDDDDDDDDDQSTQAEAPQFVADTNAALAKADKRSGNNGAVQPGNINSLFVDIFTYLCI